MYKIKVINTTIFSKPLKIIEFKLYSRLEIIYHTKYFI